MAFGNTENSWNYEDFIDMNVETVHSMRMFENPEDWMFEIAKSHAG